MAEWTGPECFMCNGTGKDRYPIVEFGPDAITGTIVGWIERSGVPCRACFGHGRDAE